MAPEQLRGEPADERSDLFSFCVTFWEALHGERPFAGRDLDELATAVIAGPFARLPRAGPSRPRCATRSGAGSSRSPAIARRR